MVNICKNPLGWLFLDFCLNVRRNRSCLQWVFCCNKSTCCEAVNTKNAKDEIKKSTKGSTKGEVRVRFSNIAQYWVLRLTLCKRLSFGIQQHCLIDYYLQTSRHSHRRKRHRPLCWPRRTSNG